MLNITTALSLSDSLSCSRIWAAVITVMIKKVVHTSQQGRAKTFWGQRRKRALLIISIATALRRITLQVDEGLYSSGILSSSHLGLIFLKTCWIHSYVPGWPGRRFFCNSEVKTLRCVLTLMSWLCASCLVLCSRFKLKMCLINSRVNQTNTK